MNNIIKIYNLQEDGSSASVTFGTVSTALSFSTPTTKILFTKWTAQENRMSLKHQQISDTIDIIQFLLT